MSKSKIFHKVLHRIERVALTDLTVLISGEFGTRKAIEVRIQLSEPRMEMIKWYK